jgi:hypothetical protein
VCVSAGFSNIVLPSSLVTLQLRNDTNSMETEYTVEQLEGERANLLICVGIGSVVSPSAPLFFTAPASSKRSDAANRARNTIMTATTFKQCS